MPSRWWIPMSVDPQRVKLEHVHAATSAWFDKTQQDHDQVTKAYAISPLGGSNGGAVGIEIGVLTDWAATQLHHACRSGETIRLGGETVAVGTPEPIIEHPWAELDVPSGDRAWRLNFLTPTTFRKGNRSSPLPVPASVLRGLQDVWNVHSGCGDRALTAQESSAVWVAEIEGHTERLRVSGITLAGFVGTVQFRASDQALADKVDPLFRLAPYAGVGSFRGKGLGVVRYVPRGGPMQEAR